MHPIILTALGVGGATVVGALIGFLFKKPSHKFNDIILSFAAGVMLAAAVIGLILPSLEYGTGDWSIVITIAGIFCGALVLNVLDRVVPHLHKLTGLDRERHPDSTTALNKVLLFVLAIGIHNFPEGIAAGVSFGGGNTSQAITVALSIALQNIPEGMVIIAPMLAAGISRQRAFLLAMATGMVEVLGTFIGFTAVHVSLAVLPFALAFAGGTMLYVISDEMIPETHSHGNERGATYSLLAGFSAMMLFEHLI